MAAPKKQTANLSKSERAMLEQALDTPLSGVGKTFLSNSDELKFDRFEWEDEEALSEADIENILHFINNSEKYIDDSEIYLCRGRKEGPYLYFDFYSSNDELLVTQVINHDKLEEPGSPRTERTESMDDEKDRKAESPLRPRWAEEARPKKQVKLRLKPSMISEVDAAAGSSGKNRNDWIEEAIQKALDARKPKPR